MNFLLPLLVILVIAALVSGVMHQLLKIALIVVLTIIIVLHFGPMIGVHIPGIPTL